MMSGDRRDGILIIAGISQYSLIDHGNALNQVFPAARAKNVFFVIGSSLNAGFISGGPRYHYGKESVRSRRHSLRNAGN
jgi:aryl-alcohol dehydrogenase-like predicted oxidoreductase